MVGFILIPSGMDTAGMMAGTIPGMALTAAGGWELV